MQVLKELHWPVSQRPTIHRSTKRGISRHWTEAVGQLITICKKIGITILYVTRSTDLREPGASVIYQDRKGIKKVIATDKYTRSASNLMAIVEYLEHHRKMEQTGVGCTNYYETEKVMS